MYIGMDKVARSFTYKARYGEFNSHDMIKIIAIFSMVIDHLGIFFFDDMKELRAIGRIAFPLFAFLVGYSLKYENVRDMAILFALQSGFELLVYQSQDFYQFMCKSILVTLICIRLFMRYMQDYVERTPYFFLLFFLLLDHFLSIFISYGGQGFLFAICGFFIRKKNKKGKLFLLFTMSAYFILQYKDYYNTVLIVCVMLFTGYMLNNYSFSRYKHDKIYLLNPLLYLSRNSLLFYPVHYELFKFISYHVMKTFV